MIATGGMLPAVSLMTAKSGEAVALREGQGPQLLVAVHAASCEACQHFVSDLGAVADRVGEWGGRIIVARPGAAEDATAFRGALALPFRILLDPEGRVASGGATVVIADEWGEVYFVAHAAAGHEFPTPRELAEWVQFIAIQCPECEGPEGAWRKPVDLA